MKNVVSFDIFDTLITRRFADPTGIFLCMQRKMLKMNLPSVSSFVKKKFYEIRRNAEQEARVCLRVHEGREEVSIDDIYLRMRCMNGISAEDAEKIKKLEWECERDNLLPITENIVMLKNLEKGNQIVLISDMYWSSSIIREWLCGFDDIFRDIPILVSSEYDKTKSSGSLYDLFIEKYSVNHQCWVHYGDNIQSDCVMVEAKGGNAELASSFELTSFETDLLEKYRNHYDTQTIIGSTRQIALGKHSFSYDMGSHISGPILYGYVLWVLDMALERNIETLYFIARDGYVLKTIADIIISERQLEIKTKYLYGSRMAWRMPAEITNIEELKKWFIFSYECNSISQLEKDFDIQYGKYSEHGYMCKTDDSVITDFTTLKYELITKDSFVEELWSWFCNVVKNAFGYLKQEIDLKDNIAFVELNGTGYTQICLGKLLNKEVISFFYTLEGMKYFSNNVFFRYASRSFKLQDILETLCRAPHGQTIGYEETDGDYNPILADNVEDYVDADSFAEYLSGIQEFSTHMAAVQELFGEDLQEISMKYADYVCEGTNKAIVEFIGETPFCRFSEYSCNIEKSAMKYAPHLSEEEIKRVYLHGDIRWYESTFSPASRRFIEMRYTDSEKRLIEQYQKVNKLLYCLGDERKNGERIDSLFKGKSVILYGAGIRGKKVKSLLEQRGIVPVAWVDSFPKKDSDDEVKGPEYIEKINYDYIIIAVANEETVYEIKRKLLDMGVLQSKICSSNSFV